MSNFKGTPGPWIIEASHEILWIGTGKNGNTKVDDIVLHINNDNQHKDEVKQRIAANARLIAAAPEMLEAMQEFVDRVERGEVRSKKTYAKFKEIITKATTI